MWFDKIMDDLKETLRISNKNKGIFIPIFIKLALTILFGVATGIITFVSVITLTQNRYRYSNHFFKILPSFLIFLGIFILIYMVLNTLIEVGSINLYKVASEGIKPTTSHFIEGIKKYFLKIFGGSIFIGIITLIISPILFALFILYAILIGVLTAGWGMTFLSTIIMVFFLPWPIIVIVDDISPIKAIMKSFKFAKKNFLALFLALLGYVVINRYMVAGFGMLVTVICGWFISGVITTYFKLFVLLFYKRERLDDN